MNVDLDGLAANIKGALRGPRRAEWAFMVDELVRNLRECEESIRRLQAEMQRLQCALQALQAAKATGGRDDR